MAVVPNSGCSGVSVITDCSTQLREMYAAYVALISGQAVAKVGSGDFRSVEYHQADLPALRAMYNQLWDSCSGASSGLPRLQANGAQRGGPAYVGC